MAAPHGPPPYTSYPPQESPPGYQQEPPPSYQQEPPQGYPPGLIFQNQGSVFYQVPLNAAVIPGAVLIQPVPTQNVCRACNQVLVTAFKIRPKMSTHCMAVFFCLVGCWPCACLPYCMDSCKAKDIYCAKCGAFVATDS